MANSVHPKISVIVPCYNVDRYVSACLNSLAAQTHDSFEVILVDDGSTDSTGVILDEYAAHDTRFKVFHTAHRGVSAARNEGIARSEAPFISFVDGDDVVLGIYLEVLDAMHSASGATIVCCSYKSLRPEKAADFSRRQTTLQDAIGSMEVLDTTSALCATALNHIQPAYWAKLLSRELVEAFPFPEGRVYEDLWCIGACVAAADSVAVTDAALYGYVARAGSITHANPATIQTFFDFHEAIMRFENDFAAAVGLSHATDDTSYCLHLVHRLCGLFDVLEGVRCDGLIKTRLQDILTDELSCAYTLARLRGVSAVHPQMIRAVLRLYAPTVHDTVLKVYRHVVVNL